MTYYLVNGTYKFTHYGEALHFARQINGTIEVKKSWDPMLIISKIYDAI